MFLPNQSTMNEPYKNFAHGTTALGLRWKEGIVIGADRRVSAGTLIASKQGKKVHKIHDNIGMAIAGLVSDAMSLVELMRAELKIFELENEYQPTVKVAATLLGVILHGGYRRYFPYWVQLIIGGVDHTGPHVYFLDPSGAVGEEPYFAIGSGSPLALGVMEDRLANGDTLTVAESLDLAEKSLRSAIGRDAATGNGIDILAITKEGIEERKIEL
ncbi:MAG: proteasome subunit beta [Candidatus Heimdallarchaeota archaeon]